MRTTEYHKYHRNTVNAIPVVKSLSIVILCMIIELNIIMVIQTLMEFQDHLKERFMNHLFDCVFEFVALESFVFEQGILEFR